MLTFECKRKKTVEREGVPEKKINTAIVANCDTMKLDFGIEKP